MGSADEGSASGSIELMKSCYCLLFSIIYKPGSPSASGSGSEDSDSGSG